MLRPAVLQIQRMVEGKTPSRRRPAARPYDEASIPQRRASIDHLDIRATVACWIAEGLEPAECMEAMGFRVREATWCGVIAATTMRAEQMYISGDVRAA